MFIVCFGITWFVLERLLKVERYFRGNSVFNRRLVLEYIWPMKLYGCGKASGRFVPPIRYCN
jgi:hypothetical protein